jgi:TonB-dependent SusC/RagA subfamily outer membrane receptor
MKKGIILIMVFILPLHSNLFAQKQGKKNDITGQVSDNKGNPVADAIILIDYESSGVVTDSKGMYKVRVKNSASVISVFRPMGGVIEEEINGRSVINFRLAGASQSQASEYKGNIENDNINIGYGSASKKDITTRVTTLDGPNNKNAAYKDIYEMIQSSDPSVQVNGTKITIRGINSINSTDPLLIVGGQVVSSIDDISPQMVESIHILKSSDAAIYGSRGANGVIMITLTGKK